MKISLSVSGRVELELFSAIVPAQDSNTYMYVYIVSLAALSGRSCHVCLIKRKFLGIMANSEDVIVYLRSYLYHIYAYWHFLRCTW